MQAGLNRRLRVFLVEDHETVRQALKLLLERETDMAVVGEASDGTEALARVATTDVDVAVVDITMPGLSGVVVTRKLRELRPGLPVVSLTRHADQAFLQELFRAGVAGYVLKQSHSSELLRAIRAAALGQQYVDPALTHHLAAPFAASGPKHTTRASPALTGRETEVLRLVSQGHSNKEIAARLDVSNKTIEVHKANAMRKLCLGGRMELVQYALHVGWLHDV
jgi:DNA-binding NarL/FixJ family response regulator